MNILRTSYRAGKVELKFGSPNFTEKSIKHYPGLNMLKGILSVRQIHT